MKTNMIWEVPSSNVNQRGESYGPLLLINKKPIATNVKTIEPTTKKWLIQATSYGHTSSIFETIHVEEEIQNQLVERVGKQRKKVRRGKTINRKNVAVVGNKNQTNEITDLAVYIGSDGKPTNDTHFDECIEVHSLEELAEVETQIQQKSTQKKVIKILLRASVVLTLLFLLRPMITAIGVLGGVGVASASTAVIMDSTQIATEVSGAVGYGNAVAVVGSPVNGWNVMINKIIWLADYLCGGAIIFAALTWMFGNRTAAIETLFKATTGYVVLRHYQDILDFLKLF